MDPKLLAKAKARPANVKGPPPLPAVDQDRATPRPPAPDPDRPTPRPPPEEPPPTPRAPAVSAAPLTPRPLPVDAGSHDDDDEHTVMRPATQPLPRDAFREDGSEGSRSAEGEPSEGMPLELPVAQAGARKSRATVLWTLLAAVALGAGAAVFLNEQPPTTANGAAPASAPKSFTRPPPVASPGRPRTDDTLDPPIATSGEANEALPEEEVVNTPEGVRRRPRPAVRAAQRPRPPAPAPAAPGTPEAAAPAAAAAEGTAAATAEPPPGQRSAPAPNAEAAPGTPTAAAPSTPHVAAPAAPPGAAGAPADRPAAPSGSEVPQGAVDPENPYGE